MADSAKDLQSTGRNRKRFLDLSEGTEEESYRRQNLFSEWQETLKTMRIPCKKGFIGNETQYNDMIDQGLADNFEDSLSGLGVDLSTASYDMSEAILALPSVSLFKQEAVSPQKLSNSNTSIQTSFDEGTQSSTPDKLLRLLNMEPTAETHSSPTIHQLLQQHIYSECHPLQENSLNLENPVDDEYCLQSALENTQDNLIPICLSQEDHRFQYILGAATSVATKVNEESLTYLNQGLPYEIKVKKLGDITRCQGMFYHTKVRICFHERRLQYIEKEHLDNWKQLRPGEHIVEIDVPLSYGITEVVQSAEGMNVCEFDWDPSKEVGVYVKVNCISTEFTPKKHGGEKGVPFRIQMETFMKGEAGYEILHSCACQIKVFKLKGAERKHKQDKDKIQKKSIGEQEKYQKQCECTILQELSIDSLQIPSGNNEEQAALSRESQNSSASSQEGASQSSVTPSPESLICVRPFAQTQASSQEDVSSKDECKDTQQPSNGSLSANANASETSAWLSANRFSKHCSVFTNFSGSDILRLSRAEFREICGLADGIRLFNTLHCRNIVPRLTLYVCLEHDHIYNAVYLEDVTCAEFVQKVCYFVNVAPERVYDLYLQGPSKINIMVTDQVLSNMEDETLLSVAALQDSSGEKYRLMLRVMPHKHSTK